MTVIDDSFVAARSPAVHTVEIDGEAVLLDEAQDRLHHLNATGALVWACLDGVSTVGEIASDLSNEFGQEYAEVLRDTLAITTQLADEGLLEGTTPVRWQRCDDADWRRTLDQVVVLANEGTEPFAIGGSGSTLWLHLDRASTVGELATSLAEQYDADVAAIAADLRPLLDDLERKGVVRRVS